MQAELIALSAACNEAEWLRNLLIDIPFWKKPCPAVKINCDNQAALYVTQNKTYNGKSRHISLRHNSVRQLIKRGIVTPDYIQSKLNLADPLTKELSNSMLFSTFKGL